MVIPYNRPHKHAIYQVIPHTILSHTICVKTNSIMYLFPKLRYILIFISFSDNGLLVDS